MKGFFQHYFWPHSHDAADSIDDALESSTAGIRAVKISLILLAITATLQIVVAIVSGSVALLADTIHNFSDALSAVPLWVAFALSVGDAALHVRLRTRRGPGRAVHRDNDRIVGSAGRI